MQLLQVYGLGVVAGALGNLKDQRSILFLRRLGDSLDDLHVIDVESADGVSALVCLLKHLCRCN